MSSTDPQGMNNLHEQLRRFEEQLLQQSVRRDAQALAALLDDEFVEFGSSGRVYTKQVVIEALAHQPPVQMSLRDFAARQLSDNLVLVTYQVSYRSEGQDERHALHSSLWRRNGPVWQMYFHQGTPTASP
jgi:hypothetical protein